MPTSTSPPSLASDASCSKGLSRPEAGFSVSGAGFEPSKSVQLVASAIHPAVPAAGANPLPVFFSRIHPAHQAPLLPAPAEEEQLRDWLVGEARLSRRVAAELASELYQHQAVENLDDLREFSVLPEFAECVKAALVRKRVLDALARASSASSTLLPAAPLSPPLPPLSSPLPPVTPPRRTPPSSSPDDDEQRTPPPAPSKPPPPRAHAGGARRTLFADAPAEPVVGASDSSGAPPTEARACEPESDVSVSARRDALCAADLPYSSAQMEAIYGRVSITADQWHALDLADRDYKLYNPIHLALSIQTHHTALSISPDHITCSTADQPSYRAAACPEEGTPEGLAPPSAGNVTSVSESYCDWPTTWPPDNFDFCFGAGFKPFFDYPPARKPGWLPSPWPQKARCNACGKYSRPELLELGIDPDERDFMYEPPFAPRGATPPVDCSARLG